MVDVSRPPGGMAPESYRATPECLNAEGARTIISVH